MNIVGVNTPAPAPDPTVDAVLATLANNTASSSQPTRRSCKIASTMLYPLSRTSGKTIETKPTIAPPGPNSKYNGPGSAANRPLLQLSGARNGGAKCPRRKGSGINALPDRKPEASLSGRRVWPMCRICCPSTTPDNPVAPISSAQFLQALCRKPAHQTVAAGPLSREWHPLSCNVIFR